VHVTEVLDPRAGFLREGNQGICRTSGESTFTGENCSGRAGKDNVGGVLATGFVNRPSGPGATQQGVQQQVITIRVQRETGLLLQALLQQGGQGRVLASGKGGIEEGLERAVGIVPEIKLR
jgi:hypothetical protein